MKHLGIRTRILFVPFLLLLLFLGCAGTDGSGEADEELQREIRRRAEVFDEARRLISMGVPGTLERGLELLREEKLHTTERGAELAYAALSIHRILYPYIELKPYQVSLPSNSIYDELVEEVEAGRYPDIASEEAEFMTLLLSSLTLISGGEEASIVRAEEAVIQLLQVNPGSTLIRYLEAVFLRRAGQEGEALELFHRVAEEAPSCYPALLAIVELSERRGRPAEGLDQGRRLLEKFPEEREILISVLSLLISLGELEEADTLLSRAIARFSENRELLLLRALLLERRGEDEKAMRLARGFEGEYGPRVETLLVRGRVALDEERFSEAMELAERGISLNPESYRFYLLKGRILRKQGRGGDAYTLLSKEWERRSWNMELLADLLDLAVELGRWEEGKRFLELLLDYGPENRRILRNGVALYRAFGEVERALEYAQRLVELYPQRLSALSIYLDLLQESDREGELRSYIGNRIKTEESSQVRSLLYLYRSRVEDGVEEQIRSLQSALYENMQNTEALIRISELYRRQGEIAKAARYLRQAVASRPDSEELRRELRRLETQLE